jgi:hypothetical protein
MSDGDSLTKVHVDLPHHWATGGEALWALDLGGHRYRLENVPFYAYDLNLYDVVEARAASADLKPSVLRVLERSGHSTLRVFFGENCSEEECLARLRSLADLHVSFEGSGERYFALDLEPETSVDAVRARLDEWEREGAIEYETCEARVPGSFDDAPLEDAVE